MFVSSAGQLCRFEAASQGFGPIIADHFGAQSHITAWSGTGLTRNAAPPLATAVQGSSLPNLKDYYGRACGSYPESIYDLQSYIPEVI